MTEETNKAEAELTLAIHSFTESYRDYYLARIIKMDSPTVVARGQKNRDDLIWLEYCIRVSQREAPDRTAYGGIVDDAREAGARAAEDIAVTEAMHRLNRVAIDALAVVTLYGRALDRDYVNGSTRTTEEHLAGAREHVTRLHAMELADEGAW